MIEGSFEFALHNLKNDEYVSRKSWSELNYLELHKPKDTLDDSDPHIRYVTGKHGLPSSRDGLRWHTWTPFIPTNEDLLADDWIVSIFGGVED